MTGHSRSVGPTGPAASQSVVLARAQLAIDEAVVEFIMLGDHTLTREQAMVGAPERDRELYTRYREAHRQAGL